MYRFLPNKIACTVLILLDRLMITQSLPNTLPVRLLAKFVLNNLRQSQKVTRKEVKILEISLF